MIKLLDTKQLSDETGIPERTLVNWRYIGEGPPYVKVGPRQVRYRVADIEAWLEAGRVVRSA